MPFGKILIPTDFSAPSMTLLKRSPQLKSLGAHKIVLVHIATPIQAKKATEQLKAKLEHSAQNLESKGFVTRYILQGGNPASEINTIANKENIDLIYITNRGQSLVRSAFLGSTVGDLIRLSLKPILVQKELKVKPNFPGRIDRVLMATDFSEGSQRALECLKNLEGVTKKVILLHIGTRAGDPTKERERIANVEEKLKQTASELEPLNIETDVLHNVGSPSKLICRTAEQHNVDLITLSRISGGLTEKVLGSTAGAVVQLCSHSVLLVP